MRAATLTLLTLLGLVAGAFYGQYALFDPLGSIDRSHWTFVAGDLVLIRPMSLLLLPLVFAGAISSAAAMKSLSRFGLALGATLAWFAVTMLVSSILGTAAGTVMRPGDIAFESRNDLTLRAADHLEAAGETSRGVQSTVAAGQESLTGAWMTLLRRVLPTNLVDDLAAGRLLGLIVLGIMIGVGLSVSGESGEPARAFFDGLLAALRRVARFLSWIAPVGVFLLVANAVGSIGFDGVRGPLQRLCATVGAALVAHAFIVLPMALLMLGRCNPVAFLFRVARALCVAFSSASSVVALPVALDCAVVDSPDHRRPGRRGSECSHAAANLVLPLGSTLNFNGTAIFQSIAVVFLCQVYDIALATSELVVIVITATVAAISTAGAPSAGLITLIIVITAVNTSLAGRGMPQLPTCAIGILIAVDRVLDMCRTTVNVWGNLVGARIISVIAPDKVDE